MDQAPHFTANQYIAHMATLHQADRSDFGIKPDVIVSYLGQLSALGSAWGMTPVSLPIFPGQVLSNDRATLMQGPIGAPAAAMVLEELAALGTRRVWVLGYAGSLISRWSIGDVSLVDQAFSDDGTSPQYGRTAWGQASPALMQRLRQQDPSLHTASLWLTDAVYRETPAKIAHFQSLGCHMVDMETACYFHVGSHLGLETVALMAVSDELYNPWTPGFGSPVVRAAVERLYGLMGHVLAMRP